MLLNEMTIRKINNLIAKETVAVINIPVTGSIVNAVNMIGIHVHQKEDKVFPSGKVVTSGMGKAGQIALNIATTLSSTGTPATFLHPAEAQHGDLGVLQKNDVMLLVSNSGETRALIELVELKNDLYLHIPIILITGNEKSPLGEEADVCIWTGGPKEVCPLGLTPTTSTTVMTVIGDILVVLLMEEIGFTKEQYAQRHHGGYLGEKSRT